MKKGTVYIFVGNSGCGKGTQAEKLEEYIKKNKKDILHIELGSQFRDFLSTTTFTAEKSKDIALKGQLQPEFLAIRLWSDILNSYYSPEKFLILDGTPRTIREAQVLDLALDFYEIENRVVFYINTSKETAMDRMLSRKRSDDTKQKINNRLNWFKRDTMPAIEFFRGSYKYNFNEIDGEKNIDGVWKEVKNKLK